MSAADLVVLGASVGTLTSLSTAPTEGVTRSYIFGVDGVCTWLTGTPTVVKGDSVYRTFSAPSTYTNTYIPLITNLNAVDASIVSDQTAQYPAIAFNKRVTADSGTLNAQLIDRIYSESQAKNASIYLLPSGAYKARTSGLNQFVTKAYDFSPNANDATNATGTTDPFLDGFIVPKANLGIKYVAGQTQTGVLTFGTALTKLATDSWTARAVLKANIKGSARIAIGSGSYLIINETTIVLHNGTIALLTGTYTANCGLKNTIEFQYGGGAIGLIKVNGLPIVTVALSDTMNFSQIVYLSANKFDGTLYHLSLYPYRCSEAESVKETAFLKSVFPDAETVVINGYEITTQNAENIVASDGTVVNNVTGATTDGNAELITAVADRDFSSDTGGWTKGTGWSISGGLFTKVSGNTSPSYYPNLLTLGKWYSITVVTTGVTAGSLLIRLGGSSPTSPSISTDTTTVFKATPTDTNKTLWLVPSSDFSGSIDNISIKEAGWDSSTLIYDATYAATSGSVNVKTLAAQKAAAAYCLYNNDPLLGAIYGKHYNRYASALLAPKGWHVQSKAEYDQIIAYLGGASIAGGEMKKDGLVYWTTSNVGGTNRSGFSAIAAGSRGADGTFREAGSNTGFITTDDVVSGYRGYALSRGSAAIAALNAVLASSGSGCGLSLRFARNTPYGDQSRTIETDYLTTNFATGTNIDVVIPWGYKVVDVIADCETGVTAFQAQLLNAAGSLQATLLTGKTVVAGTIADISTGAIDQPKTYTDNIVRLNGTKAGTADRMKFSIKLEKQL